jgi:hypothetical protein
VFKVLPKSRVKFQTKKQYPKAGLPYTLSHLETLLLAFVFWLENFSLLAIDKSSFMPIIININSTLVNNKIEGFYGKTLFVQYRF